jgi:hypothetical protein
MQNKLKHFILAFLFLVLGTQVSYTQTYPVTISTQLTQPSPIYLSNYANTTSINSPIKVQLILNDLSIMNRQVRLKCYFQGAVSFVTNDFVVGAAPIYLEGGFPTQLTNVELGPYFEYQNIKGINPNQYAQPLPEGIYTISFEVYDFATNKKLSKKSSVTTVIFQNEPPFLNLPANQAGIVEQNIQNIIFSWTPRSINVSNVEYEFSLAEIWNTNTPIQNAFAYSPPLYTTTTRNTTVQYSIAEPQLIPGKTYAWRVKAKALLGAEEIGVFKNNGYSEIFSFKYLTLCTSPIAITNTDVSQDQAKVTWSGAVDNYDYQVNYREKNADSKWYKVVTPREYMTISNLKPKTTYEYTVGAACDPGEYTHSNIQEFTTLAQDEIAFTGCGIKPDPAALSNKTPLPALFPNDVVTAGDFPIVVLKSTGSNGTFSGEGYVTLPFLAKFRELIDAAAALAGSDDKGDSKANIGKYTRIRITFNNIGVNTDFKLISGEIVASYDPKWGSMVDGDKAVNDLLGDTGTVIPLDVQFEIKSVVKNADGTLTITGTNGVVVTQPKTDNDVVITDREGKQYAVSPNAPVGDIKQTGKAAPGGVPTPQNTNGMGSGGSITQISSPDVSVTFATGTGYYTLDENPNQDPKLKDNTKLNSTYDVIPKKDGSNYYVHYKAISDAPKAEDFVTAKVTFSNGKTASDIVFKTENGTEIPSTWSGNVATLTLKRTLDFAKESILATVKPPVQKDSIKVTKKYDIAGALNLWHLSNKKVNVTLVGLNGGQTPTQSQAQEYLNSIYGKAGIQFEINTIKIDIAQSWGTSIETGDSDLLNTYTNGQQTITNDFQTQLGSSYKNDTYYVLFTGVPASKSGVLGFMPLKRQFGFVFSQSDDKKLRTLAHELGHGIFGLQHPFTNYNTTVTTDLLMDYGTGTALSHNDWEIMHAPGLQLYQFTQGSSAGELKGGFAIAPDWSFVSNGDEGKVKASGDSDSNGFLRGIVANDGAYIWKLDSYGKSKYLHETSNNPYNNPIIVPTKDTDIIWLFFENQNSRGKYIKTIYKELAGIIKSKSDKELSTFITTHSTTSLYIKEKDENRNTYWGYVGCSKCNSDGVANGNSDEDKLKDLISQLNIKKGNESVASEAIILDKNDPKYHEKLAEALKKTSYILATYDSSGKESLKLEYKLQIPKSIKDLFPDAKTSDTCIQDYINSSLTTLHNNLIYQNLKPLDQASLEISTVFYQGFFGMWYCATDEESIANSNGVTQCIAGATHEAIAMIDVVALVNGIATLAKEGTKTYIESYVKYYENLQSVSSTITQGGEVQTKQILGVVLIPPYNAVPDVIGKVVKIADEFKKSYFTECDKTKLKNGKIADICLYRYGQLAAIIGPIAYTGGQYAVAKIKQIADISKISVSLTENILKLNEKLIAKGVVLEESAGNTLIKNLEGTVLKEVEGTDYKNIENAIEKINIAIDNLVDDVSFDVIIKETKYLPGPQLPERIASTFENSIYKNRKLATDESYFKYHGVDNRTGRKYSWLTNKKYATDTEIRKGLAIREDWGVKLESVTEFKVPAGTYVSEGKAASQGVGYAGGDYQAVITNVPDAWIIKTDKAFVEILNTSKIKASQLIEVFSKIEPKVTDDLINFAKNNGGKMEGLEYRLKTVESLERKMISDGINTQMNDVLRYTIIVDGDLAKGTNSILKELEAKGYQTIKIKNTFQEGQIYKGINTNVKSADGSIFEIQYHTSESFNVKQNINHSLYEEYRLLDKSSTQAIKLEQQMIKNSDAVKLPQNINSIKSY